METTLMTSKQAANAAGISYRQLDYWVRIGLIESTRDAVGSGARRGWTADDVIVLRTIGRFSAIGLRAEVLASAARAVRSLVYMGRTGERVFVDDRGTLTLDPPAHGVAVTFVLSADISHAATGDDEG